MQHGTKQLVQILKQFGMRSIRELVGRTDCLYHLDYQQEMDDSKRAAGGGIKILNTKYEILNNFNFV